MRIKKFADWLKKEGVEPYFTSSKPELDNKTGEQIGNLVTDRFRLLEVQTGCFRLPEHTRFEQREATEEWPAHEFALVQGVAVHLCNGLAATEDGFVFGRMQFNLRRTTPTRPNAKVYYHLALSILPFEDATLPIEAFVVFSDSREDWSEERELARQEALGEQVQFTDWGHLLHEFGPASNGALLLIFKY